MDMPFTHPGRDRRTFINQTQTSKFAESNNIPPCESPALPKIFNHPDFFRLLFPSNPA
jgi:hypothetical protein